MFFLRKNQSNLKTNFVRFEESYYFLTTAANLLVIRDDRNSTSETWDAGHFQLARNVRKKRRILGF